MIALPPMRIKNLRKFQRSIFKFTVFSLRAPRNRVQAGLVQPRIRVRRLIFLPGDDQQYESGNLFEEISDGGFLYSQLRCLCASTVRPSAAGNRRRHLLWQYSRTLRGVGLVSGERPGFLQLLWYAHALCAFSKAAKL